MKKRKMKRINNYMFFIIILVVAALSVAGVSYANWNDLLKIDASIKTGFIEPYFDTAESDDGMDAINIHISKDKNDMDLSGDSVGKYRQKVVVKIDDVNGALPTKIKAIKVREESNIVKIDWDGHSPKFTMTIDAEDAGSYEFKYEIICEQAY